MQFSIPPLLPLGLMNKFIFFLKLYLNLNAMKLFLYLSCYFFFQYVGFKSSCFSSFHCLIFFLLYICMWNTCLMKVDLDRIMVSNAL
jgi:hypothetical protein